MTKKAILLSLEQEWSSKIEELLADCEVELYSDELARDSFDFVFTDDANYEVEENESVLIISGESIEHHKFSYITQEVLDKPLIKNYLLRFIGEDSSINVEAEISGEARSVKMTEPFSIGYYLDILSTSIHKQSKKFESVIEAFVKVSNFYFSDLKALPLDVDYIISEDYTVLQFHAPIQEFSEIQDSGELLEGLNATLIDNYFLKKSQELVISLVWFENTTTRSLLKHHLDGFSKASENTSVYEGFNRLLSLKKEDVEFNIENDKSEVKRSPFSTIKKIIDFAKAEKDKNPELFSLQQTLDSYPNHDVVKSLVQEDIDFIEKAVSSYNVYDTINSTVKGSREKALKETDIATKLAQALEEMESFEAVGMFANEDEAIQRIAGSKDGKEEVNIVSGHENLDEESQIVKGSKEDLGEETMLVKGSREVIDDTWRVKRSSIAAKVKEEVMRITSLGDHSEKDIQDRVRSILKEELGVNDQVANKFQESLVDNVSSTMVGEEIGSSDSQEVFLRLDNERLRGQLVSKTDQIIRMKKIIDSMKADFVAKKQAEKSLMEKISSEGADSYEAKFKVAEVQISALLKEVNIKEKREEQLINSHEHALKNKDHRIFLLEDKLEDLKEKEIAADSSDLKSKVSALETENKNLANQLKLTNERFEAINEKYEAEIKNGTIGFQQSNDSGLQSLLDKEREKVENLQSQINEFKKQLAAKPEKEEAPASPLQLNENEARIKEMEAQLKSSELEVKKYEQKIKFMSSQMNELEKKLKKMAGRTGGAGAGKAASDLNIKRLEKNLEKINLLNDKLQSDMTEKKKELHKAKQENSIMQNRISELEKKLAKYEKKAA